MKRTELNIDGIEVCAVEGAAKGSVGEDTLRCGSDVVFLGCSSVMATKLVDECNVSSACAAFNIKIDTVTTPLAGKGDKAEGRTYPSS